MEQAGLPETVPACSNSSWEPSGTRAASPGLQKREASPRRCESQRDRVRAQARAPPRRRGRGSRRSHSEAW